MRRRMQTAMVVFLLLAVHLHISGEPGVISREGHGDGVLQDCFMTLAAVVMSYPLGFTVGSWQLNSIIVWPCRYHVGIITQPAGGVSRLTSDAQHNNPTPFGALKLARNTRLRNVGRPGEHMHASDCLMPGEI
jgi:hypothetical protein